MNAIYREILIVIDDMIADILNNKILKLIVTELFIRSGEIFISLVFITQSYFPVPKNIKLNAVDYINLNISNKRELHEAAINHLSDIDFKHIMKLYKRCTKNPYFFQLTIRLL